MEGPGKMTAEISHIDSFMVDLDGTTYLGDSLIAGAADFYHAAVAAGKKVLYLTNNSSRSPARYHEKLRTLGIPVREGEVFTSGEATISYLEKRPYRSIFPLATADFRTMMAQAGFDVTNEMQTRAGSRPDCVVLGYDTELTYEKLKRACLLLIEGAAFVASHPDAVCPTDEGPVPDAGSMLPMIEAATNRRPEIIVGKPNPLMLELALKRMNAAAGTAAMVGDRLSTDIAMAADFGITSVLVLTGGTTRAEAAEFPRKIDHIFTSIADMVPLLRQR